MGTLAPWLLLALQGAVPSARERAPESPKEECLRIGRALYASDCVPVGAEPALTLERRLTAPGLGNDERLKVTAELGHEWVELGRVPQAIPLLEGGLADAQALRLEPHVLRMHRELGLAYLRLAEDQNCVQRHTQSCCILPLADDAVHGLRAPAEKAREHYMAVLERAPDELGARWLVNVLAVL